MSFNFKLPQGVSIVGLAVSCSTPRPCHVHPEKEVETSELKEGGEVSKKEEKTFILWQEVWFFLF